VTEAAVPASPLSLQGRFYSDIGGSVNTGIAIANPNDQAATISFFLTDESGQSVKSGSLALPGNGQIAAFLNESPFNIAGSFRGTLTYSSSVPVSVVALRGFTNERSEFLITTLPVSLLTALTGIAFFPHFSDGGGWTTQFVLTNPTDSPLSGSLQFFDQGNASTEGKAVSLNIGGQAQSSVSYTIPPRSSRTFQTSGLGNLVQVGSGRIVPDNGNNSPDGVAIFSFKSGGVTVSATGVPALHPGNAFRLYAEASGSIQTGIAITNPSTSAVDVTLELSTADGKAAGTASVAIPASGQIATFLNQVPGFANLPASFQGTLRVSTSNSAQTVAITGLRGRYNERGDFLIATTIPINESAAPNPMPLVLPHFADSGGWITQFIMFNIAQMANGTLSFFSQSGQPLTLTLR
jgi:hypothetical protein